MNFGYVPNKKRKVNVITKIFGWLSVVRRMQVPVIIEMLDLHEKDFFLDLGCGGGNFVYKMSKRCKSVGVDISSIKNLGFAQKHQPNLNFRMADGFNLPFKDNSFDGVLLGGTLQAVEQDNELIIECSRILKEEEILVLYVIQERRAIRMTYENNGFFTKKLITLFNLPKNYAKFEKDYVERLNMTKFYTVEDLTGLVENTGFKVIDVEFAPKEIGSKILDILLILSRGLKIPQPNHPIYFPILYPLIYFADKLSTGKLKGNEFIMKAKRGKEKYAEK
jgi:ubiquinone/menaquinone biosynthesis C-methylase UbiE